MTYDPRAILGKEPVVIAGALRGLLYVAILGGWLQWSVDLLAAVALGAELVLGLFVRQRVTPMAAPTLPAGAEVSVEGSSDSVVIAASPPGPMGVEGGAA